MLLPHKTFEITFEDNVLGSVFIDISISNNYKEMIVIEDFLLDTGATSTIINSDSFKALEFDDNILVNNLGVITLADGSKRETSTIILKTIKIGNIKFSNFPVRVLLSYDFEDNYLNILGTDLLKYFDYTINMSNKIMKLILRNDYMSVLDYDKMKRKNKEYYKDLIIHSVLDEII